MRDTVKVYLGDYFLTTAPADIRDRIDAALANETLPQDSCIKKLSLRYNSEYWTNPNNHAIVNSQQLQIDSLWPHHDEKHLSCHPLGNYMHYNVSDKMRVCTQNMSRGMCCDKFVRRTLAAQLFPELYNDEKTK